VHLLGPSVEPGDGSINLPKLNIVVVDELSGRRDGGFIVDTIQLDYADRSVVVSNDKRTIG
jgi:hypothetical protein